MRRPRRSTTPRPRPSRRSYERAGEVVVHPLKAVVDHPRSQLRLEALAALDAMKRGSCPPRPAPGNRRSFHRQAARTKRGRRRGDLSRTPRSAAPARRSLSTEPAVADSSASRDAGGFRRARTPRISRRSRQHPSARAAVCVSIRCRRPWWRRLERARRAPPLVREKVSWWGPPPRRSKSTKHSIGVCANAVRAASIQDDFRRPLRIWRPATAPSRSACSGRPSRSVPDPMRISKRSWWLSI